jgi:CoA:oxalate CoA-transferase
MDGTGWPDGPATRVGTAISDIVAGIFAYAAIVTALAARARTGRGTTVDIAMLDSTFALLGHGLMDALGVHKRPTRLGNRHPFSYPFDTFNCSDQPLAIAVGNDHLFGILCKVLGLATLPADTRFATNVARCTN